MIFKSNRYIILSILISAMAFMVSCTDKFIEEEGPTKGSEETGYYLETTISLQSLTRAGTASFEDYEDYIDPEKINLLFFYADKSDNGDEKWTGYNTLIRQYNAEDLYMIPIESSSDGTLKNWYIRIPVIEEEFAEAVRKHDFKIVALANWSKEANIALNNGDDISMLHHIASDNQYKDEPFTFLREGKGQMGLYQSWVNNNKVSSIEAALESIRKESYPGYEYNNGKGRDKNNYSYYDLRFVWNFNGAYNYGKQEYDPSIDYEYNSDAWAKHNNDYLYNWLNTTENGKLKALDKQAKNNNFSYTDATAELYTQGDKIGVKIPVGRYDDNATNSSVGAVFNNAFIFDFPASGSINIKWDRTNNSSANLIIQRIHNNGKDLNDTYSLNNPSQTYPIDNKGKKIEMKVTGDSESMAIYADGEGLVIYEIEYVKDQYLYETDRSGAELSSSRLIQMFGVQEYDKLENYWKPGTLFNLSNYNRISSSDNYNSKEISLLRSVAKVELKIPITMHSHHVYLRSMNRRARLEPMDVSTPTDKIWVDYDPSNLNKHPEKCEWNSLIGHTPFYDPNSDNVETYKNKLAWYYGSWKDKNGEIGGVTVPKNNAYGDAITSPLQKDEAWDGYPHIINPYIQRTDFAEFIYTGEADGIYDRYVLYVPEKFVDDPNNDGKMSSSPKVCHIEFRRGPDDDGLNEDSWANVDDNNCYRIYFTKDGFYNYNNQGYPTFEKKDGKNYDTWENSYEQNVEILKQHWPIVRNHLYSFTVKDSGQVALIIDLEVLPWKEVEEMNYVW